jgi:hypothetical protein
MLEVPFPQTLTMYVHTPSCFSPPRQTALSWSNYGMMYGADSYNNIRLNIIVFPWRLRTLRLTGAFAMDKLTQSPGSQCITPYVECQRSLRRRRTVDCEKDEMWLSSLLRSSHHSGTCEGSCKTSWKYRNRSGFVVPVTQDCKHMPVIHYFEDSHPRVAQNSHCQLRSCPSHRVPATDDKIAPIVCDLPNRIRFSRQASMATQWKWNIQSSGRILSKCAARWIPCGG